jgi:hypothetical protein
MCGIVGLHLKNPGLQPRLGELLTAVNEDRNEARAAVATASACSSSRRHSACVAVASWAASVAAR